MKVLYFLMMAMDIVLAHWYASDGNVAKTIFFIGMAGFIWLEKNRER